jgi:hypothetical protein
LGISLVSPYGAFPPLPFNRNAFDTTPTGLNPLLPNPIGGFSPDMARMNQLQSQYGNMCGCARCTAAPGMTADDMLQKIKAESYAHILGHEQAHQSAAGGLGGGINIQYDGNGVAVAGHVPISIPGLDSLNPENSMRAYNTIRGAALAPSDPSGADMSIASYAQSLMGQAQVLMGQKKQAQSLGIPFDEYRKMGMRPLMPGGQ